MLVQTLQIFNAFGQLLDRWSTDQSRYLHNEREIFTDREYGPVPGKYSLGQGVTNFSHPPPPIFSYINGIALSPPAAQNSYLLHLVTSQVQERFY